MKKKAIIVSKTHLDLGFTDYASVIVDQYIHQFIPNAIKVAKEVNTESEKNFVWTVGSWILKTALEKSTAEQKQALIDACKRGDIVAHAMPFTTHTELMDGDLIEYGLSIIKELDQQFGWKTIAAKMTDVPGHTKALIPYFQKAGIKFLHIGVNGASALCDVPPCFVWKHEDSEIIVLYDGEYGSTFACDFMNDVLIFDHTLDNKGVKNKDVVLKHVEQLKRKYADYEVKAGRMDEYAALLLANQEQLPVIEEELGDSWIHGAATDPYKVAAFKELLRLKTKWLADGTMEKESKEYRDFMDHLLCVAEHTWGLDTKTQFSDFRNYLRKNFDKARAKNKRAFQSILIPSFIKRKGAYSHVERSWREQRAYVDGAISALGAVHQKEAETALNALRPKNKPADFDQDYLPDTEVQCGNIRFSLNRCGGISNLMIDGVPLIKNNESPVMQYHSYGLRDYDFWKDHYTRNYPKTKVWSVPDFMRPNLKCVNGKYKQGRFDYGMKNATISQNENECKVLVNLSIEDDCYRTLGAANCVQILYSANAQSGFSAEVFWFDKPANRLPEATYFRLFPNAGRVTYQKIGQAVDPLKVVKNGNRNISAVEKVNFTCSGSEAAATIENLHAPLVCLGAGKILEFDNQFESVQKDGLSYILHDNIWGTNFPLWYDENAYFKFEICLHD